MKFVVTACLLALFAATAVAEPHMSYGPPGHFESGVRQNTCQYGFVDTTPGSGWTLGLGQQLGISCPAPGAILSVGFYVEFMVVPGNLDIVVYDDGVEVSRTTVFVGAAGVFDFDIADVAVTGTACIMLCPIGDYWSVTGEDYASPPYGSTYFSNNCTCNNPFTDNNLTIWAETGEPTGTSTVSWGSIRALYR